MGVGDLVVHREAWKGYLFVITEIVQATDMCRCAIVKSSQPTRGYEVGYIIRWKPLDEFALYKK